MSLPIQSTARCCIRAARSSYSRNTLQSTSTLHRTQSRRWQSTEAAAATNPKIEGIVSEIGKLTLLETADLIKELKVRLWCWFGHNSRNVPGHHECHDLVLCYRGHWILTIAIYVFSILASSTGFYNPQLCQFLVIQAEY